VAVRTFYSIQNIYKKDLNIACSFLMKIFENNALTYQCRLVMDIGKGNNYGILSNTTCIPSNSPCASAQHAGVERTNQGYSIPIIFKQKES